MRKKLLLIGGGGHCGSVMDSVLTLNTYDDIGIVDYTRVNVLGVSTVGTDDDLPYLFREGWTDAFITVGSVGNVSVRKRLYEKIKGIGFFIPTIIDPSVIIAQEVKIGEGCFIGKRAVINTGSSVGCCSIINTAAIIEHDCFIGPFAHISPGVILCGKANVGEDSHIGAGTVVKQQLTIGSQTVIGAGSNVVKDIPSNVIAFGNPCKVVRER